MLRSLFLILIVLSLTAFGQTKFQIDNPKAQKIDEFESVSNKQLKMRIDAFFAELQKDENAQPYIINYGSEKDLALRKKQVADAINFRKEIRISFIDGGYSRIVKTELWIVPSGADSPVPSIADNKTPLKILEPFRFEKISVQSEHFNQWIFGEYFNQLKSRESVKGYILIKADDAEFAEFENKIRNYMTFAKIENERILIKKGNAQNPLTAELWLVPKELQTPIFAKKAEKLAEFGKLKMPEWKRKMKAIAKTVSEVRHENSQLYIVTYGNLKDVSVGEKLILDNLLKNCPECYGYTNFKINFVRGRATGKAKRVFWLIPEDGEIPKF
ncbi:MAG TPA: hypothetical protein PKY59_20745 [Pyrinomonadaceae bacterium]|nr:hypothetical protein [Pyrinomonadaceae bacterium]